MLGAVDLHWGTSEHALDGKREDAEMQLHHFDPYFGGLEDAAAADAVVSLAVTLRESESESHLSGTLFAGLAEELESPDETGRLLPPERYFESLSTYLGSSAVFGLYRGTTTRPPCAGRNWVVAAQAGSIKQSQVFHQQKQDHLI